MKKTKERDWICKAIIFCIVLSVHIFYLIRFGMNVPWDNDDCKTYMIGAFLSHKYEVSQLHALELTVQYYGPGQQLIYLPLFWICSSLLETFKLQLYANAIVATLVSVVTYEMISSIVPNVRQIYKVSSSIIVGIYPPLITGTIGTNNETFIRVFPVFLLYIIFKLEKNEDKKTKNIYSILLGILTAYELLFNARCIVAIMAVLIVCIIDFVVKKKKISLFSFGVSFIVGICLYKLIYRYILNHFLLPEREIVRSVNTTDNMLGEATSRVSGFFDFTIQEVINFFTLQMGVLFCGIVITGGMIFVGIYCLTFLKDKHNILLLCYATSFFVLNYALIIVMNKGIYAYAVQSMLDTHIYERYINQGSIPLIIVSIIMLYKYYTNKFLWRFYFWGISLTCLFTIKKYATKLVETGTTGYRIQNLTFFSYLAPDKFLMNPRVYDFVVISIWIFAFAFILFFSYRYNNKIVLYLFIGVVFFGSMNYAVDGYRNMIDLQNNRVELCRKIFDSLDDNLPDVYKKVYLLYDGGMWRGVNMQVALDDYVIQQIDVTSHDLSEFNEYVSENTFVMIPSQYNLEDVDDLKYVGSFSDARCDFGIYAYGSELCALVGE